MPYLAAAIVTLVCVLAIPLTVLTLPGAWMAIAAASLCNIWQPGLLSWWTIGACVGLALLGEIIELIAGALGAAKAGGSKSGAVGAIVGTIIGAVVGTLVPPVPVGTILGAAIGAGLGAMVVEMAVHRRDTAASARIAAGAAAGRLVALMAKLGLCITIGVVLSAAAFL